MPREGSNDDEKAIQDVYAAYRAYAIVKYCYQVREGYMTIYINDVEMERASHILLPENTLRPK